MRLNIRNGTYKVLGVIICVISAGWYFFWSSYITRLDNDFAYTADIVSTDQFFDEEAGDFSSKLSSSSTFSYSIVGVLDDVYTIRNLFDLKTPAGEPIFAVERLYGIDPVTLQHVKGSGDRDREGYLFAPRDLKEGESFTYWHINYDGPAEMQFVAAEVIGELPVYHYETRYENVLIDQTENLGHLPGVPETRGVILEPFLELWIDPVTRRMIRYQDDTIAYYYDIETGEKINPWNHFRNQFTTESVQKQVEAAKYEQRRLFIFVHMIPTMLFLFALFLFWLGFEKKITLHETENSTLDSI